MLDYLDAIAERERNARWEAIDMESGERIIGGSDSVELARLLKDGRTYRILKIRPILS